MIHVAIKPIHYLPDKYVFVAFPRHLYLNLNLATLKSAVQTCCLISVQFSTKKHAYLDCIIAEYILVLEYKLFFKFSKIIRAITLSL